MTQTMTAHEALDQELQTLAKAAGHSGPPLDFLRAYFRTMSADALGLRSAPALFAVATAHWQLASQRGADEVAVRLIRPKEQAGFGDARHLARLQTVIEDMPFLVDSVLMRVRAAGAAVDWASHPILRLKRDSSGALQGLSEDGSGQLESLIHIEFEPLASAQAYARLEAAVRATLMDVRTAVADYPAMRVRLRQTITRLERVPNGVNPSAFAEARAFLEWIDERHFTFLGWAESKALPAEDGQLRLRPEPGSGLGLLREGAALAGAEDLIAPQEELDKYASSPRVLVITKGNVRSPIHHAEYLDVLAIRRFASDGSVEGTARIIGLFSAEAYHARVGDIPVVRHKVGEVITRAQLPEDSHSAKALREILQTWPRDELFQSGEDELFAACMSVRALRERQQIKLVSRRDRYGRFFSCLVFVPRERYSRELREAIGRELGQIYAAAGVDRAGVDFLRDGFTRLHFTVRTPPGTRVAYSNAEIEARLVAATRGWPDVLRASLEAAGAGHLAGRFGNAFPLSLQEHMTPAKAMAEVHMLAQLNADTPLVVRLEQNADGAAVGLTLYRAHNPVTLSDALPVLENFGLKVLNQDPSEVTTSDGTHFWIQAFSLQAVQLPVGADAEAARANFEAALLSVWAGAAENDGLNRLVLASGLSARQVTALRSVATYLTQTSLPFGPGLMQSVFAQNAAISRNLVALFEARFDPSLADAERQTRIAAMDAALDAGLDQVASLDADRILRAALAVVRAALRTNFYQADAAGKPKPYVSIKLDPSRIPDLPLPKPMFEIWVYAPTVEGVHLRGGKVARGGLRWSDRRQDFRTEVLGLIKAQMVKNTVIVPVGAKGGFVLKSGNPADREEWSRLGIAGYQTFLRGLLDITDNRRGAEVIPPKDVVRYDGDDPYLVVAADKGTATFSDIANALSAEYGHWLGDAFASGGSVGYDHKKMGITAKGAWESVKRHFREMPWTDAQGLTHSGKDIQTTPFTVVGIGDMSGDVFGNGMLLSPQIRLLAAFDHRHIFIDPNPDCATSFAERARLFALPRSSWEDYDKTLMSAGGGVWPRSAKSIELSAAAQAALGISSNKLTPSELMHGILRAPVELLWNGGIGTYVKASTQSNSEVGDRANDHLRVNGKDLRCKVIGEGGNLGCTQLGRIEYALHGGRLNTDAIDNAGGVHSSDREVNIKIPLNQLMAQGKLTRAERDPLLLSMTDDLAAAVLRDNTVQSGAVSLLEATAKERLDEHSELIRKLEHEGLLNRSVEYLPDEETLKERQRNGLGLTRPELSVLLAYAKMSLYAATLASDMPDDPFFVRDLLGYFPTAMVEGHREQLETHQLKREIIATILSNAVANRMGVSFAHRMAEDHGHARGEVLKAYAIAHEIFVADAYWQRIEALDNKVPAATQTRLMSYPIGLLKHATGWLVRAGYDKLPVSLSVVRFTEAIQTGESLLPDALPKSYREDYDKTLHGLLAENIPTNLAKRLTATRVLGAALDVTELAHQHKLPLGDAAQAYFSVGEHFQMLWLYAAINRLNVSGRWHALARQNLRDDTYHLHYLLASRVLLADGKTSTEKLGHWLGKHSARIAFATSRISDLRAAGAVDFEGLVVAVRELRKLRAL
jgi:glutamate dehydrogenase